DVGCGPDGATIDNVRDRRTWTVARAKTLPTLACTVAVPVLLPGAVYRPVLLTVPMPLTLLQVNVGWLASTMANWSYPVAVNCPLPPGPRGAADGVGLIVVSVCSRVTLALLVTLRPPAWVIVPWKT